MTTETETAISKTETTDLQTPALTQEQNSFFFGRPIASNEIDNPDDLMGFLD